MPDRFDAVANALRIDRSSEKRLGLQRQVSPSDRVPTRCTGSWANHRSVTHIMASSTPTHLLIVNQDGELLEVMKYTLEDEGYRVSTADSCETALKVAGDKAVDLVLLDVAMDDMNGVEVARRLRAEAATTGIRIVLHSGRDEPVVRAQFSAYDGYIRKSEDPEVLLEGIRSALGRPHASSPEAGALPADAGAAVPEAESLTG